MKADYRIFKLPFQYPFTISKGTKTHQPTFIVSLEHFGRIGYGEAPAIHYYDVTTAKLEMVFKAKKMFIEKFAFTEPERYWHYLHHLLPVHPFLVCALDIAAWDLYGKLHGKPLFSFWSKPGDPTPLTDYTIGIDDPHKMVDKMLAHPWPIYKIKLGTDNDIEIVEVLRKHTDAMFRIDANAAWTVTEALEKINAFKDLGVEFIEQPLAKEDWEGMKQLFNESPIPLMADESCVSEHDVKKCEGHFHGINIKLTKCSGITPALRMIKEARSLNMKVMLGSMNESTIGSAAIAHLSPLVDYVDMDGPLLLAEDIASGLHYDFGKVTTADKPGLGIVSKVFDAP
jgi:L-alanine-DL-glutamate epimerase-like enolase superfamily enzyme